MYKLKKEDLLFTTKKAGHTLMAEPIFLDIETSDNGAEDPEDMICWMTSCQILFKDQYYLLRSPLEVCEWYNNFEQTFCLRKNEIRCVTYIHNATFDLSYLIPFFKKYLGEERCHSMRRDGDIIKWSKGPFEFRCSYQLSGQSLDKWSKLMKTVHKKMIGYYDYDKIIYQDTELNEEEQMYDKMDVIVLQEALKAQLEMYDDTLQTIPNTSTGYPRRDIRNACLQGCKNYRRNYFLTTQLNFHKFLCCKNAFAGGYTHANRFKRDQIWTGDIRHKDFRSHYPSIIKDCVFPMGHPGIHYKVDCAKGRPMTINNVLGLWPQYTTVTTICIKHIRLRDDKISMPFLQESKMMVCDKDLKDNRHMHETWRRDNGRVLEYFGGDTDNDDIMPGRRYIQVDPLTLEILNDQYEFLDYMVLEVITMRNGKLPPPVLEVVDKYFIGKTYYKDIEKELEKEFGEMDDRTQEAKQDTLRWKKLLNSIYGCMVTNPLRNCNDDETDEDNEKRLKSYYEARYSVLAYQWGMMVAAWGRYLLYKAILFVGYENILYADTDSVFYISTPEIEENLKAFNIWLRTKASNVNVNGRDVYYSYLDSEPNVKAFKALHSKCYGYVNENDELVLTIAGIPKKTFIKMDGDKPVFLTREEELAKGEKDPVKALDNLNDQMVFTTNTGTISYLVGATGFNTKREPRVVYVNGHKIYTAGGYVIRKVKQKALSDALIDDFKLSDDKAELDPNRNLYAKVIF